MDLVREIINILRKMFKWIWIMNVRSVKMRTSEMEKKII